MILQMKQAAIPSMLGLTKKSERARESSLCASDGSSGTDGSGNSNDLDMEEC